MPGKFKATLKCFRQNKVQRRVSASLTHFPSPLLHHPPLAWVKNYCIWCNLMDCWTVNMLDSQTAVLPRVKCDGWAGGSRGTYGNDQAWKERVILCAFVSLTSDHTEAFVCFSFVSLLAAARQRLQPPLRTRLINTLNFLQVSQTSEKYIRGNVSIRTSAILIDNAGE